MTTQEAEKILKDWRKHEQETDYPNQFINDLLEAQKVIERSRACQIIDKYNEDAHDTYTDIYFQKAKQEILSKESL